MLQLDRTGFEVAQDPGFGVYVHWPFCLAKCPYCDFNSHVREQVDQTQWRKALLREIDAYADLTPGRQVTSIFFGGGTPSLMPAETVGAVIDKISERWDTAQGLEITLEANPTSVEADKFEGFRTAGVNRVSLGVQSLRDDDLKALGRQHSAGEALNAIKLAQKYFDRYSFDLIYARPDQTVESWQTELDEALGYAGGHLSLYQLTIEPGTAFHTLYQRGDLHVPDEEAGAALYEITQERLDQAGLFAYEVSNHAAPGQESRHNLVYWRYGDYVGVGPGAHGRLTLEGKKQATRAHRAPEIWLERVEENGHGAHPFEKVDAKDRGVEMLLMGLRLTEGVSLARLEEETGGSYTDLVDRDKLNQLMDAEFICVEQDRLYVTPEGRLRLNSLLEQLLV